MSDSSQTMVPAHPEGPTPGIRGVVPSKLPDPLLCEMPLHIGVFFDGTGNNQDWVEEGTSGTQLQRRKDSNVARLFRAYRDAPQEGYSPVYIPGVGTPFDKIGEDEPSALGAACGAGGDGRINFGLLHVINAIHATVSPNNRQYAMDATIKALCRNGRRGAKADRRGGREGAPLASPEDEAALRAVNMADTGGLLLDSWGNSPQRVRFFKRACAQIAEKMVQNPKPKITEIFIDVYGFSRGATAARTFCNWLLEIFEGDKLCGVPTKIRFLGLFDTVASVGVPASSGLAEGHLSWADAPWLRISDKVENCVHYVAMHENRASFPSELVRRDGALPGNCKEFMFPGMHSDVGGGYTPEEQGKGPNKHDDEKLAQLPLEAMYKASLAAKVPLQAAITRIGNYDPFKVSDVVRQAFDGFMSARQSPRQVREWLFEFIAWRYQTRQQHDTLPWFHRADKSARADVTGATKELLKDIHALELLASNQDVLTGPGNRLPPDIQSAKARVSRLAKEAKDLYARLKSAPAIDTTAATLFADFSHDSFAGFRPYDQLKILGMDVLPGSWEPEGYLRWRRRYEGNDTQLVRAEPKVPVDRFAQSEHASAASTV